LDETEDVKDKNLLNLNLFIQSFIYKFKALKTNIEKWWAGIITCRIIQD
jgi:hypothetical protein